SHIARLLRSGGQGRRCSGVVVIPVAGGAIRPLTPNGPRLLLLSVTARFCTTDRRGVGDGIGPLRKDRGHQGRVARRQAQGRNRGAVVLLGRHEYRECRDRGWWRRRPGGVTRVC